MKLIKLKKHKVKVCPKSTWIDNKQLQQLPKMPQVNFYNNINEAGYRCYM